MHFFVFLTFLLCSIGYEMNYYYTTYYFHDWDQVTQYCRIYVTANVFQNVEKVTNLMMLLLLIYMTEKFTVTPLQKYWRHILN